MRENLIAFEVGRTEDMAIRPGNHRRPWMDETGDRFAYRCLPLTIANQHAWMIENPVTFGVEWNGGPAISDVAITFADGRPDERILSHFGSGIVTFCIPYLFRTPHGINLWVKGPPNTFTDGAQALEAIVETDWSPAPFTMNWKITRPNTAIRFEIGAPICAIVPVQRFLIESLQPKLAHIETEPELAIAYQAWSDSRAAFLQGLDSEDETARRLGWEKHYFRGKTLTGPAAEGHQTKLRLTKFAAVHANPSGSEATGCPAHNNLLEAAED